MVLVVVNRVTRWDPSSRAGAVAFRSKNRYDVQDVHEAIADWASYQNLAGDLDHIETSPVAGNYDWKGYLLEESTLAQKRSEKRAGAKPARAVQPESAPSTYYA
jgi:hypothetical protein